MVVRYVRKLRADDATCQMDAAPTRVRTLLYRVLDLRPWWVSKLGRRAATGRRRRSCWSWATLRGNVSLRRLQAPLWERLRID